GSIRTGDGTEVVRARALRVGRAQAGERDERPMGLPGPADGYPDRPRSPGPEMVMFATHAMDIRFVAGAFNEPGPATAWFRLRHQLLAGEDPSPLQRLAAAGDFGNGISATLPWTEHVFINPDLTLYIEREPTGDWICLQSETRIAREGVGVAESVLYDE